MGIPTLWEIIRDYDDRVPIAQLAEEHYARHKRPLRIAVDEADWRFNNLTPAQVFAIRDSSDEPAFRGIEKAIFYRICRLMTLNIQLVFVFDGNRRPAKRGRPGGGLINYESRRDLQEMLRCMRVPYHEAPGEAEAECARLQNLGLVDAVYSQDSDCLMFGCTLWIHDDRIAKANSGRDRSKENTEKSKKNVMLVRASEMVKKYKLDREGLVLYAMLAGGDYNTAGLRGCGARLASRVVQAGLGPSLCACQSQRDCAAWRERLIACLSALPGRTVDVPVNFPDFKILQKYNHPNVSSDEVLLGHSRLQRGPDRPFDELKLLEFTSSRFNIWGKRYMHWVGPILLTRFLIARDPSLPREAVHGITMFRTRAKKDSEPETKQLERKIKFSPFGLTTLERKHFEGDRLGYWDRDRDKPFQPDYIVDDREIPECWLQKVLPLDMLDRSTAPKQQKRRAEDEKPTPSKRRRVADKRAATAGVTTPLSTVKNQSSGFRSGSTRTPGFHARTGGTQSATPRKTATPTRASSSFHVIELSDSDDDASEPNRLSTRWPYSPLGGQTSPHVADDDTDLEKAIALSLSSMQPSEDRNTRHSLAAHTPPRASLPTVSPQRLNAGLTSVGSATRHPHGAAPNLSPLSPNITRRGPAPPACPPKSHPLPRPADDPENAKKQLSSGSVQTEHPLGADELRRARLKRFAVPQAESPPASKVFGLSRSPHCEERAPAPARAEVAKEAEIECIDLTDE